LLAYDQGGYPRARALHEDSLACFRDLGDKPNIAAALNNLGEVAEGEGDFAQAAALHREALDLRRALGDQRGIANSLNNLASVVCHQSDYEQAVLLQRESLAVYRQVGDKSGIAASVQGMATLARARDLAEPAARLFAIAERVREQVGAPLSPSERAASEHALAAVEATLGEEVFAAVWAEARALTYEEGLAYALHAAGHLLEGRPQLADTLS
jgi:tetratricopeptide (TPR) repeat protein